MRRHANGDGELRMHARFWNSRIRLKIGDRRYQMVVDSGEIVSIDRWYRGTACDLAIMAPQVDWEAMLELPIEEVRRQLAIRPPTAYWEVAA